SNIENADIKALAAIDATKIADGSVNNTAFQQLNTVGSAIVGISDVQTLTNKTIDADQNTVSNIENADIKALAAIDATKIADGSVNNTAFQQLALGNPFAFETHTSFTIPVDGDLLTWDNTNGRWDALAPVVTGDMFAATYDPSAVAGDAFVFDTHASFTPPVDGDVLTWDNTNSRWDALASNGLILPYTNSAIDLGPLFDLDNTGTGPAARFANTNTNGTAVQIDGDIAFKDGFTRKIALMDNATAAGNDLEVAAGNTLFAAVNGGVLNLRSGNATTGNGGVLNLRGGNSSTGSGGNIRLEPGTGGLTTGGIDMRGVTRFGQTSVLAPGRIELEDDDASNTVSISAPSNVAISYDLTLPSTLTAGVLTTDAGGTLTWNPAGAGNYIIDANENQKGGASAAAAITIGVQNLVLGNLSGSGLTVGNGNVVAGHSGGLSLVGGSDNLVIGRLADVTGDGSNNVVLGDNADAAGSNSVVIGASASASGNFAIAIGENTQANGVRSLAFGAGTIATTAQTAIIGDGISNNSTFDVGIGTNAPTGRLGVATLVGEANKNGIVISQNAVLGAGLIVNLTDVSNSNDAVIVDNAGSARAAVFRNTNVGNVASTLVVENAAAGSGLQVDKTTDGNAIEVNYSGTTTGSGLLVNMNLAGTDPAILVTNSSAAGSIVADGDISTGGSLISTNLTINGPASIAGAFVTLPTYQITTAIPTPTSRIMKLDVGGGFTLSNIGAGQDGQEFIIINRNISLIQVDLAGNILLNGGVAFNMSQNSTLHLVFDSLSGKWLEIGRSAN
ncbi:MAG: hypothetical protein RIE86_04785, partial [Imperialibacter sp.]|uniref:beta strand repeat-containing protein n=1 Tax=Imperialibacter sp. TaxID=2038411 RepID=UPI0032F0100C